MILTVTLNPVLDKNYTIKNFALDKTFRVENSLDLAAGKGLNVARVIQKLGHPTKATGILGGNVGKLIEACLKKEEVPADFVSIRAESRFSIVILDPYKGTHTELIEPGPSLPQGSLTRLRKKIQTLSPKASWVVFAGSPPPDTPANVYVNLIKDAKTAGAKVLLDTRVPWLREGLKAKPDLIKPNWEEFQELVGPCRSTVEAVKQGRSLIKEGIEGIVISMGPKGAIGIYGEEGYFTQRLPKLNVISPVGSGDSLVAGLLTKLEAGWEFKEALRFSLAIACSNACHFGAGIFTPEQVDYLYNEIELEKLPY